MRKFSFYITVLLLLAVSGQMSAQLYVNNSYVYVADKYLFVNQDVNLQAAGHIFLRNESQLLQATTGSSANQGVGDLSVFQEGTSNNFAYNYWCSPVGVPAASIGNSSFGITQLYRPTGLTNITSTPATIIPAPTNDGTTSASNLSIASRWIFKFLSSTTYSQWFSVGAAPTIGAGEGFTMKGVSGTDATTVIGVQNNPGSKQRYDFRGKPNDGTIDVNVISTAGNRTLTGNPYPSAIDLNMFLTDPANTPFIDGTALFWEHDPTANSHILANYRGGYGVYNGATGVYTPATFYNYDASGNQLGVASVPMNSYQRRFCPVGQGFMVRGIGNGVVKFKNTYRVFKNEGAANNSEFHRLSANQDATPTDYGYFESIPNVAGTDYTQISKAPTPHITINASLNNQAVRQIALCFLPSASDGVDKADSKSADVALNLPFDMYFFLDDTEYIQSAASFGINKRFPIGFKNNQQASFKIQVANFINFNLAENVYLHDKETDIYHDIKNAEFEMTLAPGVYNSRFEITFVAGVLAVNTIDSDGFDVVQSNASQTLVIANPKLIDVKSVSLYDISGKLVFAKQKLGSKANYQLSTAGISEAVYVVKIVTANGKDFSKKITIYHAK